MRIMNRDEKLQELSRLRKLKEKRQLTSALANKKATESKEGRPTMNFGSALDTGFGTAFGSLAGGIQQVLGGDKERLAKEAETRNQNFEEAKGKSWIGAQIGNLLGGAVSTAPLAAIPGLGQAGLVAKLAKSGLGRTGLAAGRGAAEGAGAAALQYIPEGSSRLGEAAGGALWGGLPTAGLAGGAEAYNALRPSTVLGKGLNERQKGEIAKNLAAARGTETQLGEVLQNPNLSKFYENFLTTLPFSGAMNKQVKAAEQVKDRAESAYKNMTGNGAYTKENAGEVVQKAVQDVDSEVRMIKEENYKYVNKLADELGLKVDRNNLQATTSSILEELNKRPDLKRKMDSGFISDLENFSQKTKKGVKQYYTPEAQARDLKGENILKGIFREEAGEKFFAGKRFAGGGYSRMNKALKKDINSAIENSNSPELRNAYKSAEEYYAKEIGPLDNPLLHKAAQGRMDTDTLINSFIKKGRPKLTRKLVDQIDKSENAFENMQALRAGIFDNVTEKEMIHPAKLSTAFNQFGEQQQLDIFSGQENLVPEMENIARLSKMNEGGLNAMFNPKTGQKGIYKYGWNAVPYLWGAGPLRSVTNRMTNEAKREKFVGKVLKQENVADNKYLKMIRENLTRSLAATNTEKESKPYRVKVTGEDVKKSQQK